MGFFFNPKHIAHTVCGFGQWTVGVGDVRPFWQLHFSNKKYSFSEFSVEKERVVLEILMLQLYIY